MGSSTSLGLLLCLGWTGSSCTRPSAALPIDVLAHIESNDNRTAAGVLRDGILTLALTAGRGLWYPNRDDGTGLRVFAFGESGQALQNPGPLIRVPTGTEVHVRLHNGTGGRLVVHGLVRRPSGEGDSLVIEPDGDQVASFRLDMPGTYYYWGSTTGQPMDVREGEDGQLAGAIVVDPPGVTPADRIFVIGLWLRPAGYPDSSVDSLQEIMALNGKGWPNSERLEFTEGDTVRWRLINTSNSSHPMHLHGFYFQMQGRGDGRADTLYDAEHRFLEVTELMLPGGTATLQWVPDRVGHWLFHCHFSYHISPEVSLPGSGDGMDSMPGMAAKRTGAANWHHGMGGLVLGLNVLPRAGARREVAESAEPRRIRLLVQSRAHRFGLAPGYGYVAQTGRTAPSPDSILIPGMPLFLVRGQPVRITIVNHLSDVTAVHWHGIELESPPDGVPGWSGVPPSVTPPILPADSFVAAFTPPRAGTFIYHTHMNELEQMHLGLYGPLIVLEPGARWNPASESVILVSPDGESTDTTGGLINGSPTPQPLRIKAGRMHRLRLISIHGDDRVVFSIRDHGALSRWRPVAKDGAELPAALAQWRPAEVLTGPGETEDVEIRYPKAGRYTLVATAPYAARPWQRKMEIVVE